MVTAVNETDTISPVDGENKNKNKKYIAFQILTNAMKRNNTGKKAKAYLPVATSILNMEKIACGHRPAGSGELSPGNDGGGAAQVEAPASGRRRPGPRGPGRKPRRLRGERGSLGSRGRGLMRGRLHGARGPRSRRSNVYLRKEESHRRVWSRGKGLTYISTRSR